MISQTERKRFRAIAHKLKPVVTVAGNGLSEGVLAELQRALTDHELIKVKLHVGDRWERKEIIGSICETTKCELIAAIGNVAVLYRKAEKPDRALSNVLRADVL